MDREEFTPALRLLEDVVEFDVGERLRKGTFGSVGFGWTRTLAREPVAVKQISMYLRPTAVMRNMRELLLMKTLQHPNIIPLLGAYCSNDQAAAEFYFLVMPKFGCSLREAMADPLTSPALSVAGNQRKIMWGLFLALKFLKEGGIIHRDIKSDNLLVDLATMHVKLCDFGFARHEEDDMTEYVVTRYYRAPEIILAPGHYDFSIDMWSAGCVMCDMLSGRYLFQGRNRLDQIRIILSYLGFPHHAPELFEGYHDDLGVVRDWMRFEPRDMREVVRGLKRVPEQPEEERGREEAHRLMMSLLKVVARERIAVEEALEHAYFKMADDLPPPPPPSVHPETVIPRAPADCPDKGLFYRRAIFEHCTHLDVQIPSEHAQ